LEPAAVASAVLGGFGLLKIGTGFGHQVSEAFAGF
jgi:hypothetical protein